MKKFKAELAKPLNGYAAMVILLVSITVSVVSLSIALAVNRASERKFCSIVDSSIRVYEETPPVTPAGQNAEENWRWLKSIIDCEK